MKKLRELFNRGRVVCAVLFLVLAFTPNAFAEYEIDTGNVSADVPTDGTIVQWTSDVNIEWVQPTMSGGDVLQKFVYKWNTSDATLNDTDFNVDNADGAVEASIDPPVIAQAASFFAADDSNVIRYLHIKTWFLDVSAGEPVYSTDVVIGPINIDNVAPSGTVWITDSEGTTITSTQSTSLNVGLNATLAPAKFYLSETSTRPGTGTTYATTATYDLSDTTPGNKTLYAWFEDGAGNISTTPATYAFELVGTVSISPYETTIDLASSDTQIFKADGTTANYDWTIENESSTGVAQFSGSDGKGVNEVTIQALKEGTFTLKAVPTGTGDTLTSGTITVSKTSVSKTFSLITTSTTNVNTIGFIFADTGITTAHELGTAIGNVDLVSKWNEATQSYSSHPMAAKTFNNFSLEVGKAYFVSVTSDHDFTLTGKLPTGISLNLVTTATTNVNAVGVPKSKETLTTAHTLGQDIGNVDLVSKWDASTQSYSSHPMAAVTFNNFSVDWGNGYFISVTQDTQWDW